MSGAAEKRDDVEVAEAGDRDALGCLVRVAWIEWALEQPNPKPSWLVPWAELAEEHREADRRIGETVAGDLMGIIRRQRAELEQASRDQAEVLELLESGVAHREKYASCCFCGEEKLKTESQAHMLACAQHPMRRLRELAEQIAKLEPEQFTPALGEELLVAARVALNPPPAPATIAEAVREAVDRG